MFRRDSPIRKTKVGNNKLEDKAGSHTGSMEVIKFTPTTIQQHCSANPGIYVQVVESGAAVSAVRQLYQKTTLDDTEDSIIEKLLPKI